MAVAQLMANFDRERLIKLLGMLGSDHDGERAAAARMVHEFARNAGLSWDVLIAQPERYRILSVAPSPAPRPRNMHRATPRRTVCDGWRASTLISYLKARRPKDAAAFEHIDVAHGLTDDEWLSLMRMARAAGVDLDAPPRHK